MSAPRGVPNDDKSSHTESGHEMQIGREGTEAMNGVTSGSRDSARASHAASSEGARVVGDPRVTPKETTPGS